MEVAPPPAAAGAAAPPPGDDVDTFLTSLPLFHVPGRTPRFAWRAPGDVDRASDGAAARRLYAPGALHEACRAGDLAQVVALLDARRADVDELDGVRRGARTRRAQPS